MLKFFAKLLFLALSLSIPVCFAQSAQDFQCSNSDIKDIDLISRNYFEEHSAFSARDVTISSQRCLKEDASAILKLKYSDDINTVVYLHKVQDRWQVLVIGSSFNNKELLAKVPKVLRDATQGA